MAYKINYNPDILSCLANLSNDEVFTPPEIANAVLDLVPELFWSNPNVKVLNPACKSGVFLREAAKRFIKGLEKQIPDLQERLNHIFHKQLYGFAITELTGYMSRRSLYCSKNAHGNYSVSAFDSQEGNIFYNNIEHTWDSDSDEAKCIYCGAAKAEYNRVKGLEQHAYEFIHLPYEQYKELDKMHFDLIIGNPPYQLGSNDSRSTSRDKPIYNLFVDMAKKLSPSYIAMIIPSRWMATGLGLKAFRKSMLEDKQLKVLVDYPISSEVFNGVEVKGGICYFLWQRNYNGLCSVTTIRNGKVVATVDRNLNEYDIFVRDNLGLPILHKVLSKKERSITDILSVDKEFGWTSNFDNFSKVHTTQTQVPIYYFRNGKRLVGWIEEEDVKKSRNLIHTFKLMVPEGGSDGGQKIPDLVLGTPFVTPSPSVCTQTYLFFYCCSNEQAESIKSYIQTKFVRFLISLRKLTQHATRSTYVWVPMQDWSKKWTDEELYEKYELTLPEINHIETQIKAMGD